MSFIATRRVMVFAACMSMLSLAASHAATTVFMDYTNFSNQLNTIALSAGVPSFTPAEELEIKANILGYLQTAFDGFDVSFSESPPGGDFPTLTFALSGGGFGQADHIDYRNKQAVDTARTFTTSFDTFVEAAEPRPQQILELSTSLAGTSAHELGHNFGLRHHDSYGNPSITYSSVAVNTGGVQNTHIMATGSTGINEPGREVPRTFSEHSLVKLSFAQGLNPFIPDSVVEAGDYPDTVGTALPIALTDLTNVDRAAANIVGEINNNGDSDVFSVVLEGGSRFTADVNVDFPQSISFNNVNTLLELIDTDGTTVLATGLWSRYSDNILGAGGSGETNDPWLLNIPIPSSGTYFVRISPEVADNGDYELLLHSDLMNNMPSADFNGDGTLGCADIDSLVVEIVAGTNDPSFDLTMDGLVDLADRNAWLAEAGMENLASGNPYLLGDANLDGFVDAIDFTIWNDNKFTQVAAWCSGDFNADGSVDGVDFTSWNDNKFQMALHRPSAGDPDEVFGSDLIDLPNGHQAVPEPSGLWMAVMVGLAIAGCGRRPLVACPA